VARQRPTSRDAQSLLARPNPSIDGTGNPVVTRPLPQAARCRGIYPLGSFGILLFPTPPKEMRHASLVAPAVIWPRLRPPRLKGSLYRCGWSSMRNHERPQVPPDVRATRSAWRSACISTMIPVSPPHIPTSHGGQNMTKVQAAYLQATWNQLGSPLCKHLKIDLERSEDGSMTGSYRCTDCGDAVAR